MKLPRSITHEARLLHCAADVARFYGDIAYLQPKLAAVLIQLPPSLEFSAATVRTFFKGAPKLRGAVVTCEPRHASWFTTAAEEALRRVNVARVAADPAPHAGANVPGGKRRFAYFRWHGTPQMYYSKYSDTQLAAFALNVKMATATTAWCVFDNTARYAAWDDALRFVEMLKAAKTSFERARQ